MSNGYRKFLLLWLGEFISSIGGGLTSFGLTVYIFNQTGSASGTAVIALLAFLPTVLLEMPAGVLADRMDRRLLMMLGDGLSALGLIYILICMLTGGAAYWQICVGVVISAVFSALMDPAYQSTITDLLTEEEYTKSSGLVNIAGSARYLLSPLVAGLLLTFTGIETLIIIDICTFFLTVAVTAAVRKNIAKKERTESSTFIDDMKVGWRAVSCNKGIMTLLVMTAVMNASMGAMQILAEPMLLAFTDSRTLGIAETVCACGMLVSALVLGFRGIKKRKHRALCFSLAASGLFMIIFGIMENLILIGISGFMFFAMLPIENTCVDYLVRTNIDNELQGRAWGLVGFISQMGAVIAFAATGFLSDFIAGLAHISVGRGSAIVIMAGGVLLIAAAVVTYMLKSVRNLEKE